MSVKLSLDQNIHLFQVPLHAEGKKPGWKKTGTPSMQPTELFMGVTSWLARQPAYIQGMVQFLGVFSFHPDDLKSLRESLSQNWQVPFSKTLGTWKLAHRKMTSEMETEKKKTQPLWDCSNCDMENQKQDSRCMICDRPKPTAAAAAVPSSQPSFHFDLFRAPAARSVPSDKKKSDIPKGNIPMASEEAEKQAMMEWKTRQLQTKTHQDTSASHPKLSEGEGKEFNFIYKILSELNQEQVKNISYAADKESVQPRFLFSLFKNDNEGQVLLIDKVSSTVEWFDPLVPPTTIPSFRPDPSTEQLQKIIQQRSLALSRTSIPAEVKEIESVLQNFSASYQKWTILANREANKKKSEDTPSDLYALWYLSKRFAYEEAGGPVSAEALDHAAVSSSELRQVQRQFFD